MKKTYKLLIPAALFFLVFSNYSCKKVDIIQGLRTVSITAALSHTETVNATTADIYTKESIVDNQVKTKLDSMKINKDKIKAAELQKAIAIIDANSAMDFSDIESASLYVNGTKWGEFPANVKGKSVELTLSAETKDILNVMVNEPKLTFKYQSKTNKATPATKITMDLTVKVDYQVL